MQSAAAEPGTGDSSRGCPGGRSMAQRPSRFCYVASPKGFKGRQPGIWPNFVTQNWSRDRNQEERLSFFEPTANRQAAAYTNVPVTLARDSVSFAESRLIGLAIFWNLRSRLRHKAQRMIAPADRWHSLESACRYFRPSITNRSVPPMSNVGNLGNPINGPLMK